MHIVIHSFYVIMCILINHYYYYYYYYYYLSDGELPSPRGAAAESGLKWSQHEGLGGESAETESERGSSAMGLDFPLTGEAVNEKE